MSDVVKQFETHLRQTEGSLKMIDATNKTLANNEKNVADSEANAPGCDPIAEAQKKLADCKDLLAAHTVAAQQKLNATMMSYDLAKRVMTEPLKERYQKLLAAAKEHGLSVV